MMNDRVRMCRIRSYGRYSTAATMRSVGGEAVLREVVPGRQAPGRQCAERIQRPRGTQASDRTSRHDRSVPNPAGARSPRFREPDRQGRKASQAYSAEGPQGQAGESQLTRPVNLRFRLASSRCNTVLGQALNCAGARTRQRHRRRRGSRELFEDRGHHRPRVGQGQFALTVLYRSVLDGNQHHSRIF